MKPPNHFVGELHRRDVRPSWFVWIGKETNKLAEMFVHNDYDPLAEIEYGAERGEEPPPAPPASQFLVSKKRPKKLGMCKGDVGNEEIQSCIESCENMPVIDILRTWSKGTRQKAIAEALGISRPLLTLAFQGKRSLVGHARARAVALSIVFAISRLAYCISAAIEILQQWSVGTSAAPIPIFAQSRGRRPTKHQSAVKIRLPSGGRLRQSE
jgi:hypothetical protein